jgi:hypothetical protein
MATFLMNRYGVVMPNIVRTDRNVSQRLKNFVNVTVLKAIARLPKQLADSQR